MKNADDDDDPDEIQEIVIPDDLPRAKPFYPKALICFVISVLSLAWLISLEVQSARSGFHPGHPANAASDGVNSGASEAAQAAEQKPAIPARDMSDTDYTLSEIEILRKLSQTEGAMNPKKAATLLRPYTLSTNAAVREMSTRTLALVMAAQDALALQALESTTTRAKTFAETKDYASALDLLNATLKNLPEDAKWTDSAAQKKLQELIADYQARRAKERASALDGLEDALSKNDPAAKTRLTAALAHVDPQIREEAAAIQSRASQIVDKAALAQAAFERAAREDWVKFFRRFAATLADGDFTGASDLVEQPPFETITKGGTADPAAIFKLCNADIQLVQTIYDEALKDAKGIRKQVSFHLRRGGQAAGTLMGVNGRMLRINPGKGAEIGVKVTDLTAEGVKAILDSGIKKQRSVRLGLAVLEACENAADAEKIIVAAYEAEREPLPRHWAERFRMEKALGKTSVAEDKLKSLKKALDADNADDIKAALAEARPALDELKQLGGLSEENRALIERADKVSAKKQLATVTLQNGKSPEANYRGINTDQISEYPGSARRTDVGVGYGLRLGAAGGIQRALIKFDGLEAAVGHGRVRKATLQLYQVDSPKSEGAVIGIFRVKRAWVPDAGSWMSWDGQKDHDWAIPGAGGEADIEPREDTNVTLDKKTGMWRSWDVTKFVLDALSGKTQNNGMLLKVVNGEPEFHVRFYPETDLDRPKDSNLRPRLVLDIARDTE